MNTTGFIRGYIARSMDYDKFFNHVIDCIGQEFNTNAKVEDLEDKYRITINNMTLDLSKDTCSVLKKTSPYALDKYILEELKTRGFDFNINRSQYIQYCYGIF
ncbi:hypothetical protein [Clostridium omnivorum]|uniref:Uncharacterized protein n=1 Tax=Clostridium omnivorum TaxID=1604902 RepID=A0ABQ5N7U3_9CLOT|nr:hypothetical protein [Clostridium sp. E14]GLC31164.1 hypothetical protein bsdE14_25740 [Clostridium sp. E14]